MRVLIACEESQTVLREFVILGHDVYSCDLLDTSGEFPDRHIKGDAVKVLHSEKWDLVIAHPPCTRIANSGVRWLNERNLWADLNKATNFFNQFLLYGYAGNKVAIENPIPHKYALDLFYMNRKYDQIIHPHQFGHGETKATCLWLFGLPKLTPTNIVPGREQRIWKMSPGKDRSKERSKTYPGIAKAMAEQWGVEIMNEVKQNELL